MSVLCDIRVYRCSRFNPQGVSRKLIFRKRKIKSVCAPAVLLPVGRKCLQGTPTLRVSVTAFIRPHYPALSRLAARGGVVLFGGARPHRSAKLRHPAISGKASPTLQRILTCCKGFTSGYAALATVRLRCAPPSISPPQFFTRGAPAGGVLTSLRSVRGVRSTPRPLYRRAFRRVVLLLFNLHFKHIAANRFSKLRVQTVCSKRQSNICRFM